MDECVIGLEKSAICTPALLVDLEKMEYNIAVMADFFRDRKASLRPHTKTHKTPMIARKQIEAGAIGITCQKLAEAEVMAKAGIKDILISNEVIGSQKVRRLINLSQYTEIKVAVDNYENIGNISKAAQKKGVNVGILVEVNIGMNRCGISPEEPALKLAQKVEKEKNLDFLGLMGYEGHTVAIKSYQERKSRTTEVLNKLLDTKGLLEKNGLECKIVSAGGTGTYDITGSFAGITEIQAGSYVVMDETYGGVEGIAGKFKQALSVLTSVMSRCADDRAVLDVGIKAIGTDKGPPGILYPKSLRGAKIGRLSEEHTCLVGLQGSVKKHLRVGEKIEMIPSHCCTTMNLHDYFYGIRNDVVESIWSIEARGKAE